MIDVATHRYEWQPVPTFPPTAVQEKLIREPMAFMVIKAAFYAHILYQECIIEYTEEVPIAATDGKALYFNPEKIRELGWTIQEICFVEAHEVSHVFLGDIAMMAKWAAAGVVDCGNGLILPYNHELMNAAQDYRINAMLIEAQIGKMPKEGLYDRNLSEKGFESAVEIYAKLYKKTNGGKDGKPGKGFDKHLAPSKEHIKAVDSGRMDQVIASAALSSEGQGQGAMPQAIKRMVGDILEPKISWQDHLKSTINRAAGDPQYDWRTIDRRLLVRPDPIYFAKQAHTGAGTIVIGIDTSGSISQKQINRFFAEMNGIVTDLNPQQLVVIWCDAAVHRVDELDEPEDLLELHTDIQKTGAGGGGGTDFRPVFKTLEEMEIHPDMLVYLTDALGTFPATEPDNYPTIWGVIGKGSVPWGTRIAVEL
jgi:predicted metal-dependent peptidase